MRLLSSSLIWFSFSVPGILSCQILPPTHWVATWGASPSPQLSNPDQIEKAGLRFNNQTVREIVHLSIGGSSIRLRFSNAYSKVPVDIGSVHLALRQQGSAIIGGSDRPVLFGGKANCTIPPDAVLLSDPVSLPVPPSSDLAVSVFLPTTAVAAGIHYSAQQSNYVGTGNLVGELNFVDPLSLRSWVFITGIDVLAPGAASTLVAFGDSITDGSASTNDANHRWPNFLADRLATQLKSAPIGVVDAGIGGNRILHDPNSEVAYGINALARFDRDVLAVPGVKFVIVLEGINDLGHAGPSWFPNEQVSADDITGGLKQLAERAHEKGLKIFAGTLTPFVGVPFPGYFSEEKETKRKAVNTWIRTSHAFDGIIDFEKAIQDPDAPDRMATPFDSGDHLHPKDAGIRPWRMQLICRCFNDPQPSAVVRGA